MCVAEKRALDMQRKLLTNGNIFKQEVKDKITAYLADLGRQLTASDESKAKLEESMGRWLRVFKFSSVERGTYDRLECTAKHQIYPILGGKVVGDITSADIKALPNH